MCPTCNGDLPSSSDIPQLPSSVNGTSAAPQTNNVPNGVNGEKDDHTPHNPKRQPFSSVGEYLSNVSNFKVGAQHKHVLVSRAN